MSNVEELPISVTLTIRADDLDSVLVLLDVAREQIERGSLAGQFGGYMGMCLFSVDLLDRVVEHRDEAVGEGADETPKNLSTED